MSFHPFPRLPLELRLKIWSFTFPQPSRKPFIRLETSFEVSLPYPPQNLPIITFDLRPNIWHGYPHATTTPEYDTKSFIHVLASCREARDLYFQIHHLTADLPDRNLNDAKVARTRYDPLKTTLYLSSGIFFASFQTSTSAASHLLFQYEQYPALIEALKRYLTLKPEVRPPLQPASFFHEIRILALPLSHFTNTLFYAYALSPLRVFGMTDFHTLRTGSQLPNTRFIPLTVNGETYPIEATTVKTIGILFSNFKKLEHLYLVLGDRWEHKLGRAECTLAELREQAAFYAFRLKMLLICFVEHFGEEESVGEVGGDGNGGKWKVPEVEVWEDGLEGYVDPEGVSWVSFGHI